jgi:GDP-L-fucose synthase
MDKQSKIYIAGHSGLVGSAIVRKLKSEGYSNLVFSPIEKYDLRIQDVVNKYFNTEKPEYVFLAAAKVGGIAANMFHPAEFIYDNLMIECNIIHAAYKSRVKKLLFLGSSCSYPKNCPQPMKEEYLLTGILESTNEAYAIAKISGLKMCEFYNLQYGCNFISLMPTNIYGQNDNFDLECSHVIPALIRKMCLGKYLKANDINAIRKDMERNPIDNIRSNSDQNIIVNTLDKFGIKKTKLKDKLDVVIELWGTGSPRREFLFVDDLAEACLFLMLNYNENEIINVGYGEDYSIKELAKIIRDIVGFDGRIDFNTSKSDGNPQKLLDVTRLKKLGWYPKMSLKEGIKNTYNRYITQ